MSATPEQIAERLDTKAEQHRFAATQSSLGDGSPYRDAAELFENTAALIRAQAERVRVLEEALNVIAQWDISDRPLIANEDNIRAEDFPFYVAGRAHAELALISNYARNSVARAALKAAP